MNASDKIPVPAIPPPMKEGRGWPMGAMGTSVPSRIPSCELPRFSVVIPSFNQGRFIEATLRSILLQDYPADKVECIVIDGGSTDETHKVLDYYSPWLTYRVSEPDRGQSHAINKGMARANGDLRGFMNSDDFYMPGAFRAIAGLYQRQPGACLFYGDRVLVDEEGVVLGVGVWPLFDYNQGGWCNIKSETAFWTKAGQEAVGLINEDLRFAMDTDYFLRLYKHAPIAKVNRAIGAYRSHPACKSATIYDIGMEEAAMIWKREFGKEFHPKQENQFLGKVAALFYMMREPRYLFMPWFRGRTGRLIRSFLS